MQIAKNGLGSTAPNPMVGCVIVHEEQIIAEGFTSAFGGNHAEVNAIKKVKDKSLLAAATLYVTLEPCSHFGKTPPCSDLIIEHDIREIVIGCVDDNPEVAGKGIAKLKAAGCKVTVGVLEAECKQHHKRFFTFHNKKRPYIVLKWAATKNGFIAPIHKDKKEPVWITNPYSRQLTHKWRAEEQAILVGTNTVLEDNPSLTVRDWTGKNPIRITFDTKQLLPEDATIYNEEAQTVTFTAAILDTLKLVKILFERNINSVIIEGGAKTLQSFIDANLWDEARVFTGNAVFVDGIAAPKFQGRLISSIRIVKDDLNIYIND